MTEGDVMDGQVSPGGARPLRIGDRAPVFHARSTAGPISLETYRGRWLLLFSHPADFTPVCTTEFVALAKAQGEFEALGFSLAGLSVDSLYAHLAWIRSIRELFGVEVAFPIIEDPTMAVGRAYGMIDETASDSATVRASYFIDPQGIVRAINWYPYNVGRSVDEMLRLAAALRLADDGRYLTPEGWRPGQRVLAPPTTDATGGADWFCREVDAQ
jgi:peroxiredoxin (alkyl hydroperoxide reductase subunit C)